MQTDRRIHIDIEGGGVVSVNSQVVLRPDSTVQTDFFFFQLSQFFFHTSRYSITSASQKKVISDVYCLPLSWKRNKMATKHYVNHSSLYQMLCMYNLFDEWKSIIITLSKFCWEGVFFLGGGVGFVCLFVCLWFFFFVFFLFCFVLLCFVLRFFLFFLILRCLRASLQTDTQAPIFFFIIKKYQNV